MEIGQLAKSIIKVIRKADTFLTPKEIRDALKITNDIHSPALIAVTQRMAHLRATGRLKGIRMFCKSKRGTYTNLYLNGLPEFYDQDGTPRAKYEQKLIDRIIDLNLYFLETELGYMRPCDYA